MKKCFKKNSVGIPSGPGTLLFFVEKTMEWIFDIEIGWLMFHDSWGEEFYLVFLFNNCHLRLWSVISEVSFFY